jgi:hypothetical protein
LHRELTPLEDAAVGWAVAEVTGPGQHEAPTLGDIARLLSNPTQETADQAKTTPEALAQAVEATRYGLDKLAHPGPLVTGQTRTSALGGGRRSRRAARRRCGR